MSVCKGMVWIDKFLHHLKTMENHCLLVCAGESSFQGFLGGAGFRPSAVCQLGLVEPFATRFVPNSCWASERQQLSSGLGNAGASGPLESRFQRGSRRRRWLKIVDHLSHVIRVDEG